MFLHISLLNFILLIFVLGGEVLSIKACEAEKKEPWSYSKTGDNGHKNWGKRFPECNGTNQSPIDISTHDVVDDDSLNQLELVGYEEPISSANIKNNGHTVQITPTDGVTRSVQNGGLSDVYNLVQFHFHWGKRRNRGSEHSINNRRFPLEMHLVHMNSKNEIAVVGVFYEESSINNPGFGPLVTLLKDVKYKGNQTTMKSKLEMKTLIPSNLDYFFRYAGSLTTPPCSENVIWTVLAEPLPIGAAQREEFRQMYSTAKSEEVHCNLVDNYRPVQPLNARVVTAVRKDWKR